MGTRARLRRLNLAPIEKFIIAALVGMVLALGIAEYSSSHARHRDAERQADLTIVQSKITAYHAVNARYPVSLAVLADLPTSACRDPRGHGDCSHPDYTYKAFKGGSAVAASSPANCDNAAINCDSYILFTLAMETQSNPYVLSSKPF